MDDAAANELRQRILDQGWDQGCLLEPRTDLFLSNLSAPLTPEAERLQSESGSSGPAVVHEQKGEGGHMIVVSQRCDLVADPNVEPICEAIPLIEWPEDRQLPLANSARYFVVNRDRRLVADQTRRLEFEKSLLPDRAAEQLIPDFERWRSFCAWLARRFSRVAFPDEFNLTIGSAIGRAIGKGERPELQAIHSWRVMIDEDDGVVNVALLVPYDEEAAAAAGVPAIVDEVVERARELLPNLHAKAAERAGRAIKEHRLVGHLAQTSDRVTLRDLREALPLSFDHLTYTGEEVRGVEPDEEQLL